MNISELKEMVMKRIIKEGAHSACNVCYGPVTKETFIHRKQLKWVDTSERLFKDEVDQNYLICTPNLSSFVTAPAKTAAKFLQIVRADMEIWIDGVKYKDGNTLAEALAKTDYTIVAYVSEQYNYRINPEILELVESWENGGKK